MNVAIMQPYFFPYLGYFNLIHSCDTFIFLDNVQHIARGFVNRNRILLNNESHMFTVPLARAPRGQWIKDRRVSGDFNKFSEKFMATLNHAYSKAPNLKPVLTLVSRVLENCNGSLASLCRNSILEVCGCLGLERTFFSASDLMDDDSAKTLKGKDIIIHLARHVKGTCYTNPEGGIKLYAPQDFAKAGLELRFIKPRLPEYGQSGEKFVPALSIIDVLMFAPFSQTSEMLKAYDFIT